MREVQGVKAVRRHEWSKDRKQDHHDENGAGGHRRARIRAETIAAKQATYPPGLAWSSAFDREAGHAASRVRGSIACTATSATRLSTATAADPHIRNAISTV